MKISLIIVLMLRLSDTEAIISKCIRKGEDKVTFNCPEGHVMYQPIIFVGKSTSNTCTYEDGDCTGLTYDLVTQKNKCYWQSRCTLRWRDQLPIVTSNNTNCKGRLPNYINMENPVCVPNDAVFDICSEDVDFSHVNYGVIRSHSEYPWTYISMNRRCKLTLPAKSGHSLVVTVDEVDIADGDFLSIRKISKKAKVDLFNGNTLQEQSHRMTEQEKVELTFTVSEGNTVGIGFLIKFEYTKTQPVQAGRRITSGTTSDFFHGSLFNVLGAIEECITPKREQINITCPSGHVIYKPEMKVGVSTDGRCSYRLGDCLGMTHTFLTQKNVCYWKESCEFTWRSGIPITMSQSLRCLSLPPRYISLSGYSCIEEGKVVELCDKRSTLISKSRGVIKSHSQYPWHYKAIKHKCKKVIRIPKGGLLRMRTQDIDLDPDTKGDNIKIYHLKDGRSLRKKLRGSAQLDETFDGGCIEISFRVSPRTKAGRGFVIKFETYSNEPLSESDYSDCKTSSKKSRSKQNKNKKKKRSRKSKKTKGSQKKRSRKPSRLRNNRRRKPRKPSKQ